MRPLYKKSIKDVTRRKLRAVLTVLGIAIGVAGLTAITITQGQIKSAIQYSEDATGLPDITFYTTPTTPAVGATMRTRNNVKTVEAAGVADTEWSIPSGHKPLQILGFQDLRNHQLNRFELTSGSWPARGQILMESSNSGLSSIGVGDRVRVRVAGQAKTLTVSGLVRTQGRPSSSFLARGQAYMPLRDLQRAFHLPGANYFMVRLIDPSTRDTDVKSLQRVFAGEHATILRATVGRDETVRTISGGILAVMQVLSLVALVLSVFLLLSTISTLVTEQIRIIGTMKAIGATRAAVMRCYLGAVAIYGTLGTILGFILGVAGAVLLVGFIGAAFTLDTGSLTIGVMPVVLAILVGVGVPLLAAVLPIYFGTKMTVHEALVGYGLQEETERNRIVRALGRALTFIPGVLQLGPRGALRRGTRSLLGFVPGTMQLGIRNLFRKRTRALLTLLALSVSAIAFMAVQTTSYSFSMWLTHLLDTYRFDVAVSFTQPQRYDSAHKLISTVPGVGRIEPTNSASVDTNWGSAQVSGVLADSQLYHKQMVAGRWFRAGERNVVVISTQGRDKSHLTVGDSITVRDKLHTAHWRIVGVAVDNNGILTKFGQLVTSVAEVNRFRGLPAGLTDTVVMRSINGDQAAVTRLSKRIDDRVSAAGLQATVMTVKEVKDRINGQVNILRVMLYALAVIVALAGAIGLFNTLAMSVLERRREIGILRSMGASGRKVTGVFWTEALSMGVLAWVVGVALGIPAAYGFVWLIGKLLMPVPFAFNPFGVVFMLAFIAIVATLASVIPAWGAARVRTAQTLRYEG
jgi:putative ABC transport system permease protein